LVPCTVSTENHIARLGIENPFASEILHGHKSTLICKPANAFRWKDGLVFSVFAFAGFTGIISIGSDAFASIAPITAAAVFGPILLLSGDWSGA
jgi:hypothetical protein